MAIGEEIEQRLESLLAKKDEQIAMLARENKILHQELAILRKGLFGRKTERLDPGQLTLYMSTDVEQDSPVSSEQAAVPTKKKCKGHGRAIFASDIPREAIGLDLNARERACPVCGREMCSIGADITERGHIVPARLVVRRYVKEKYACPDGHAVRTAEAPAALIDRCKYEPSVYAHIATSKYCDHIPLNRLSGIFKRHGVHLPKQTMWDMLVKVDEIVAQPILKQMRAELLESEVLHADETPVPVRNEGGKGSRTGYVWDWRAPGGDDGDRSLTQFTLTRERHGPKKMLGQWSGTLITDGYSGYDEVTRENGIVRAGCWAHARRKLKDALDLKLKDAAGVLVHVQRLFWIERAMKKRIKSRELKAADLVALRRRVRPQRSARVIERLYAVAGHVDDKPSTLPKSKLGKALGYLFNQRRPLEVFLEDPRIEIHNNDAERDLRHVVVGRNNWMVFASPRGGEVACRLYSLVLSCKHAGVDPEAYIEDVLVRVSTTPASQVASLTPWAWAKERQAAEISAN
jgi:transposase